MTLWSLLYCIRLLSLGYFVIWGIYTYLYIRRPDKHREVGDADFVLDYKEFTKLKSSLLHGVEIKGIEILDRPNLDLIKLSDPEIDTLSFLGSKNMTENIKAKTNQGM